MKITVYRFYSPDGTTNQWMGVIPTQMMSKENTKTRRPAPHPAGAQPQRGLL